MSELRQLIERLKHGKHDQSTHGRRGRRGGGGGRGSTSSGGVIQRRLDNASPETLQKMRQRAELKLESARNDWQNAQNTAYYVLTSSSRDGIGSLFRRRYEEEVLGQAERKRVLMDLAKGKSPREIIPEKVKNIPDFFETDIGKSYLTELRRIQPALRKSYGRLIDVESQYQKITDAIGRGRL